METIGIIGFIGPLILGNYHILLTRYNPCIISSFHYMSQLILQDLCFCAPDLPDHLVNCAWF